MKKVLALILALAMIALCAVASAATIEITHDDSYKDIDPSSIARVYLAYKVFDASYTSLSGTNTQANKDDFTYDPDDAAVAYTMATDSPWLTVMQAAGQTWFDVKLAADSSKYVITPKEGAYSTSANAKAFGEYLQANIPSGATSTEVTVDAAATTVEAGYYLIVAKDAKDGVTRLAVVTTDTKMVEKNTYISTGKTTAETSYSVGDTVTYTATVEIPSDTALTEENGNGGYKTGHGPVILHDKMDTALTFDGTDKITAKIGDQAFSDFTANANATDDCTFEITIPVTADVLGKTITFTYTATVNDTAATDEGFVNKLFGENNGYKTKPDEPRVYTFDFSFLKDFVGVDNDKLTATFELRTKADDAKTAIKFNALANGKQEKSDDDSGSTIITIHDGETINLVGLKAGTYYLVETSTDTGYNLLDGPVTVTITDTTTDPKSPSHEVTCSGANISSSGVITVENKSGTVLPSTGGIGTTIFYIVGGLLVIGAAVILVARRKAEAK